MVLIPPMLKNDMIDEPDVLTALPIPLPSKDEKQNSDAANDEDNEETSDEKDDEATEDNNESNDDADHENDDDANSSEEQNPNSSNDENVHSSAEDIDTERSESSSRASEASTIVQSAHDDDEEVNIIAKLKKLH